MLKEQIKNDIKDAMKEKKELKISVLRMISSAISGEEIAKGKKETGMTDEEVVEVLAREVKKRKDSISQFESAGRIELAEKERQEIEVILKYLPDQLSPEDIEKLVGETIKESGARSEKDFGTVMKSLSPKIKGRADGKQVSEIVKKILADCQC
ncbi:hypothetical protein A2907_00485 [Candidatus Azambacteria bacterium RIFCSPLOWO2_01_FULL_37_9]|uniref:Glutamyl-tRNA amidotransferase n=1 Tax=Candidatus Azambacteria bacterium RIFCSPLOWO2_01_FULL_37_9 TaxID=1797297 RepID=A0A1F5C5X4_9BACT|nr:MAG: hypothetical protein A2907_00485 [Candidatus Azambacteria bacterium RIFCSPLOWO2_01_FULL_37_9]